MTLLSTGMTQSDLTTDVVGVAVEACVPGLTTGCVGFSIYKPGNEWCDQGAPGPPPPPPPRRLKISARFVSMATELALRKMVNGSASRDE
jgi:hypothetical protein